MFLDPRFNLSGYGALPPGLASCSVVATAGTTAFGATATGPAGSQQTQSEAAGGSDGRPAGAASENSNGLKPGRGGRHGGAGTGTGTGTGGAAGQSSEPTPVGGVPGSGNGNGSSANGFSVAQAGAVAGAAAGKGAGTSVQRPAPAAAGDGLGSSERVRLSSGNRVPSTCPRWPPCLFCDEAWQGDALARYGWHCRHGLRLAPCRPGSSCSACRLVTRRRLHSHKPQNTGTATTTTTTGQLQPASAPTDDLSVTG